MVSSVAIRCGTPASLTEGASRTGSWSSYAVPGLLGLDETETRLFDADYCHFPTVVHLTHAEPVHSSDQKRARDANES